MLVERLDGSRRLQAEAKLEGDLAYQCSAPRLERGNHRRRGMLQIGPSEGPPTPM